MNNYNITLSALTMVSFRDDLDYYCGEIVRQIYHEVNGLAQKILVLNASAQKPPLNAHANKYIQWR